MSLTKIALYIKKLDIEIDRISNKLLKPLEMTHTQFKVLMYLFKHADKIVRQNDLEQHFRFTNPTVTGIVQNLEKKSLIQRVQVPNDARSKQILLTEKAHSISSELLQVAATIEDSLTCMLTETEKDQMLSLTKKMLFYFDKEV